MRVSISMSGGWSGLWMGCSVDTKDLSAEQARIVEEAVSTVGVAQFVPPQGADVPTYEIEAETPSGTRRLEFSETGKSDAVRRVLDALRPHLRPVPPPRR